ncbi:chemotaxis protein CheD [Desulfosarcina sp.]|uniref:chemotaxis protein CheD n=1 Tax=Desulfosarcina sp. TaxID=2027861 RepID=UPI003970A428
MNIVVGVSDMKASNDPQGTLITYSLGSCIGIAIHDPLVKAGGLLHFMLPESSLDPNKAAARPFMFADTGIPQLFKAVYALGGEKRRMRVIVLGGSQVLDQKGFFNIGKRNEMAVRKIFHRNNVVIDYQDTGGSANRTIRLNIQNGQTHIKVSGEGEITI